MTTEAKAILLSKISKVLRDLHDEGARDGEAMFMLGAGADYLCITGETASWPALKARLGNTEMLGLLAQIDAEGQAATASNQVKHAYALQILGLSLAATRAGSDEVAAATGLLDDVILSAHTNYRNRPSNGATKVN
jgi:hypothetical protein